MSSCVGNLFRQRNNGHSLFSSSVMAEHSLRLTAVQTINLSKSQSSLDVSRKLGITVSVLALAKVAPWAGRGGLSPYTHVDGASLSKDATDDAALEVVELLSAIPSRRMLNPCRVGLRVSCRRRAGLAPLTTSSGEQPFPLSMAVRRGG